MKAFIQRVVSAEVSIDWQLYSRIGKGLLVFLGVRKEDTTEHAMQLARKTLNLRIFPDNTGKMNLSVLDIKGNILVVSQFTLYAETRKGNRPGFALAADPHVAEHLYNIYVDSLRKESEPGHVATGVFRASMQVSLINDGPVTIEITTDN